MGSVGTVVSLGLCVLDELLLVDDFDLGQERTRYHARAVGPGGMAATAAAQAARLGCRTHLLSAVGDDAEGRLVARRLRELGVATRRLVQSADHPTTVAHVLVDRRTGDRRFVVADRRRIERGAPEFDLSPIRSGGVLLLDGHFPRNAMAAARRARACGAPVVADLADARPAFRRLLPLVDHPIVPLTFVDAWGQGTARETLRALAAICPGTPVVTQGARGALAWIDGRAVRIPPRRVRVRDTTGAGDAFHGGFAAALALGGGVADALDWATRAAAGACRQLGGTASLPGRADLPKGSMPGAFHPRA